MLETIVETLIILLVIGGVIWYVLPEMKATNVFTTKGPNVPQLPYQTTLIVCVSMLAEMAGVVCFIHDKDLSYVFFRYSFIALLAAYISLFIGQSDFDWLKNFKYTLKIWFTAIFISPIPLFIIFRWSPDAEYLFKVYSSFLKYEHGLGILTLVTLGLSVSYISQKNMPLPEKRKYIWLFTEIALTINIVASTVIIGHWQMWIVAWGVYSLLLGLGIWFYNMDVTIYSDDSATSAETIKEDQID